jgi:hypothetical protein
MSIGALIKMQLEAHLRKKQSALADALSTVHSQLAALDTTYAQLQVDCTLATRELFGHTLDAEQIVEYRKNEIAYLDSLTTEHNFWLQCGLTLRIILHGDTTDLVVLDDKTVLWLCVYDVNGDYVFRPLLEEVLQHYPDALQMVRQWQRALELKIQS